MHSNLLSKWTPIGQFPDQKTFQQGSREGMYNLLIWCQKRTGKVGPFGSHIPFYDTSGATAFQSCYFHQILTRLLY